MEQTNPIVLTDKALEKVFAFATGNKEAEGKGLRIYVQGGGCSGVSYGFTFDDPREDDQIIEQGGLKVLLDPVSLPHLEGSTVDFVEDMRGAGFVVQNPNSPKKSEGGGCECSHGKCG
jgi:iron-sulfur cluster assembly accessory protein